VTKIKNVKTFLHLWIYVHSNADDMASFI